MQRRKDTLALQPLQDGRHASREVVVEQNKTGIKACKAQAIARAHQGLEHNLMRLAVGMVHLDGRGLRHLGQQAADANF